jgi:TIR domain
LPNIIPYSMQSNIDNALAKLSKADYAGFFSELDKAVPAALRTQFNALRGQYIAGQKPWDFADQLRVFAAVVAENLEEKTPIQKKKIVMPCIPNVFISFSDPDLEFRNELYKQLSTYIHNGQVDIWDRTMFIPGEHSSKATTKLEAADIIILLISSDYLADSYNHNDFEIRFAEQRFEGQMAKIFPVIVRPCMWKDTWLGALSHQPKGEKAISQFTDQHAAWFEVATAFRALLHTGEDTPPVIAEQVPVQPIDPNTTYQQLEPPMPTPQDELPTTSYGLIAFWTKIFTKRGQQIIAGIGLIVVLVGAALAIWLKIPDKTPEEVTITGKLIGQPSKIPLNNVTICLETDPYNCDETVDVDGIYILENVTVPKNRFISLKVIYPDGITMLIKDIDLSGQKPDKHGRIIIRDKEVKDRETNTKLPPSKPKQLGSKSYTIYGSFIADKAVLNNIKEVTLTDYPLKKEVNLDGGSFKIKDFKIPSDQIISLTIIFKDTKPAINKIRQITKDQIEQGRISLGTIPL